MGVGSFGGPGIATTHMTMNIIGSSGTRRGMYGGGFPGEEFKWEGLSKEDRKAVVEHLTIARNFLEPFVKFAEEAKEGIHTVNFGDNDYVITVLKGWQEISNIIFRNKQGRRLGDVSFRPYCGDLDKEGRAEYKSLTETDKLALDPDVLRFGRKSVHQMEFNRLDTPMGPGKISLNHDGLPYEIKFQEVIGELNGKKAVKILNLYNPRYGNRDCWTSKGEHGKLYWKDSDGNLDDSRERKQLKKMFNKKYGLGFAQKLKKAYDSLIDF